MIHPRTAIRAYAWNRIKNAVNIGDRVYLSRPHPVYFLDMPAIAVYFSQEPADIISGDRFVPQEYERRLQLTVEIMDEQPTDPTGSLRVEDRLDLLGRKIERAFYDDVFFQRDLPGYTGEIDDDGLISGLRMLGVSPDNVEIGSERIIAIQRLDFEMPYADDAFVEHKNELLESYMLEIRKVGWDDYTIDPIRIAADSDYGANFIITDVDDYVMNSDDTVVVL